MFYTGHLNIFRNTISTGVFMDDSHKIAQNSGKQSVIIVLDAKMAEIYLPGFTYSEICLKALIAFKRELLEKGVQVLVLSPSTKSNIPSYMRKSYAPGMEWSSPSLSQLTSNSGAKLEILVTLLETLVKPSGENISVFFPDSLLSLDIPELKRALNLGTQHIISQSDIMELMAQLKTKFGLKAELPKYGTEQPLGCPSMTSMPLARNPPPTKSLLEGGVEMMELALPKPTKWQRFKNLIAGEKPPRRNTVG